MLDSIICALTNAFRIYLVRRFMMIFVNYEVKKVNKTVEFVSFLTFYIINTSLYLFLHISWVNLICNIVGIYLLACLYTKSEKLKLFITFATYTISIVCDMVGVLLFVDYEEGKGFNQIFQIVIVFLVSTCVLMVEKIVSHRQKESNVQSLPLMLVPLSSITMICIIFYSSDSIQQATIITICIGLLLINMLVFYLYNLLLKSISEKYENEILKQKLQVYSNQIDVILQSEECVKMLTHDLKHHINELKLLIKQHKIIEIEEYIEHMKDYLYNPNEIVSSGNLEIDGVLNYLLKRAKEQLNVVNIKVQIPEKVSHSFDIVVLLSNLLENAIEAAQKTEEKYMEVEVLYKKGVLKARIANSFNFSEISLNDRGFLTTKKDKSVHGIGLDSAKRIVEKYNGVLEINQRKERFCVDLLIYLDKDMFVY